MITLTIVRHGESTDNLKALWAGWADAPLSVNGELKRNIAYKGMNQAKALGQSLESTKVDAIFTSSLLRALWTAQQIELHQEPKPSFTVSPLLREQHFGIAEQKPFGEGKGGYARQSGRAFRFAEGESLDDVRDRARQSIAAFIEPTLQSCHGSPGSSKHLVVVAHGIFNAELIGAFLARRTDSRPIEWGYKGMTNTGWTRLEVGYEDEMSPISGSVTTEPEGPVPSPSVPQEAPSSKPCGPGLAVLILCTDVTKHLDGIHRQKGGIGSQSFDEKQKDLRAFFSGAK